MQTNKPSQTNPSNLSLRLALLVLAFALSGCLALSGATRPHPTAPAKNGSADQTASPSAAVITATATMEPVRISSPTPRPPVAPGATASPTPVLEALECGPHPVTAAIVEQIEPEPWMQWVRQLSGAEPVEINGEEVTIRTRYTPAMFGPDGESGLPHARAFDYLLQTVSAWYPPEQIVVQPFRASSPSGEDLYGKNLILTLPGSRPKAEAVILSAHLDSTSNEEPELLAPGAEDNASGAAALLEAARLFREHRFERTIHIIWFTGEEQGLLGSRAYVRQMPSPPAVLGVINLDMFGYDSDGDGCFELHVGTRSESERVGRCFIDSANAYQLGLEPFDYLTEDAIGGSDHGPFWERGIGAIEVLENMFDNQIPGGCPNADRNPSYHSPEDTYDKIDPDTGIRIVRAALASAAAMAGPLE